MEFSGKLIGIEGTDGSGKKTQIDLLAEKCRELGLPVMIVDFPQYDTPVGKEIRAYLDGKRDWSPFEAADRYAADRANASAKMQMFLDRGGVVLANRYMTSNIAHQGARCRDSEERQRLFEYVLRKEYGENRIPKPDLTLVLHVSVGVSQANVDKRGARDLHERDPAHLSTAEQIYLALPSIVPTPIRILECMDGDRQLPPEVIHEMIWAEVKGLFVAEEAA